MKSPSLAALYILALATASTATAVVTGPVLLRRFNDAGLVCGGAKTPAGRHVAHLVLDISRMTRDECVDACWGDDKCSSFAYDSTLSTCARYRASGSQLGLVPQRAPMRYQPSTTPLVEYFDIDCYKTPTEFRLRFGNAYLATFAPGKSVAIINYDPASFHDPRITFTLNDDRTLASVNGTDKTSIAYASTSFSSKAFHKNHITFDHVEDHPEESEPLRCIIETDTQQLQCSTAHGSTSYRTSGLATAGHWFVIASGLAGQQTWFGSVSVDLEEAPLTVEWIS